MSNRSIGLDERLHAWLLDHLPEEPPVLRRLREETARLPEAVMQIAPEQGRFMQWLIALMGARRILEIGTFTGYSALAMALALPREGRVVTCDLSEEWTRIARRFWREAGVEDRIELRLGLAIDTLRRIEADGTASFDLAFIDADKIGYVDYYEACLRLLRPGGVLLVDNVFWDGAVADPGNRDPDTLAIRAFCEHVQHDPRIDLSILPIADGLALIRKR
ncbi:MAG: O-methyltransferase [Gammaproteobacteria bacterium]|nr:MAG: O-methyltransferase [Gammaproteobacteria bacterium]